MIDEEHIKKIEEIYNRAIKDLGELYKERQEIVREYISELENQKISAVRQSLGLTDKQ